MEKPTTVVSVHIPTKSQAVSKQPLFASQPAAGFPAPGDDMVEAALNIHDLVVKNPSATFFVRVQGDSMEGAGIYTGDVLVVDRSRPVHNGAIVVAAVYGELVVKQVKKTATAIQLHSANEAYDPIQVTESDDCFIWGVVVGSVRQF
jgi:DNA polymerase V